MKIINLFSTILTILCLIYFIFYSNHEIEKFSNYNIKFKKTNTYDLIYKFNGNTKFCIWSPRIIDDYFPMGHIITEDDTSPKFLSILVKSEEGNIPQDVPKNYQLVSLVIENNKPVGAFWKAIPNKKYKTLGYIYHPKLSDGKIPSLQKHIRCLPNNCVISSTINNMIVKTNKPNNFQIWSIHNSNYFLINDGNTDKEPKEKVFNIKMSKLDLFKKIKTKKTKSYTLIYKSYNKFTKKYVSIWRPVSINGYLSTGDIVLDKNPDNYNPNNNLETTLVHNSYSKSPLGYGTSFKGYIKNKNDIEASFWLPEPPVGYGFLGSICVLGVSQPIEKNIICCIPLEYLISSEKKKDIWNTSRMTNSVNDRLSIWKDINNLFFVNNNYSYHDQIDFKLNERFIDYEKDIMDKKKIVGMNYSLDNRNTEIYNTEVRDKLYRDCFSNRLGIKPYRFGYIKFFGKKLQLELNPRPSGSNESKVSEIVKNLKTNVKNNFKIENSKKDGFIAEIMSIFIESEDDEKYLELDNSKFNKSIN